MSDVLFTRNGQSLLHDPSRVFVPNPDTVPVFIDLDGTCFHFRKDGEAYKDARGRERNFHFEDLWEEGYYENLPEIPEMIEAIKKMRDDNACISVGENYIPIEFYVLSAVLTDSKFAADEKNKAIDRIFPWMPNANRVFVPCGDEAKADRILITEKPICFKESGECYYTPILIDDYSKNLWEFIGLEYIKGEHPVIGYTKYRQTGLALKFYNGINNNYQTWEKSGFDGIKRDMPALGSCILGKVQGLYDNFEKAKIGHDFNMNSLFQRFSKSRAEYEDIYAEMRNKNSENREDRI